jgi:hypothetical protein
LSNLGENTGTTARLPRVRPLARHQLPVPSQQRVWRDDRRDLTQGVPTQPVGAYRESPPVVIGQPDAPPTNLPSEDAILFDQIGERLPLPAIEQPVIVRSSNRRTDMSITSGSFYHGRGKNDRHPVDPELGQYGLMSRTHA